MGEALTPRDRAYLDLIRYGLVLLRNSARGGRLEFCPVEAEHLHEVPTLIGEANEGRHLYYLSGTRALYLEQLRALGDGAYLEQVSIWYTQPWQVLAEATGWQLPAWDQDTELGSAADGSGPSGSS